MTLRMRPPLTEIDPIDVRPALRAVVLVVDLRAIAAAVRRAQPTSRRIVSVGEFQTKKQRETEAS